MRSIIVSLENLIDRMEEENERLSHSANMAFYLKDEVEYYFDYFENKLYEDKGETVDNKDTVLSFFNERIDHFGGELERYENIIENHENIIRESRKLISLLEKENV